MDKEPEIIIPGQSEQDPTSEASTKRQRERVKEDEAYTPVIVKRTDQHWRHPERHHLRVHDQQYVCPELQ